MVELKDSGKITYSKIDEAITALKDLKPKERDSISDREAVRKMRRYIEKLTSYSPKVEYHQHVANLAQ